MAVVGVASGVGLAAELISTLDFVTEIRRGRGEIVDVGEAVGPGPARDGRIDGLLRSAALVAVQTEVGGVAQILHCTRWKFNRACSAGVRRRSVAGRTEESVGNGHGLVDRAGLSKIRE